ncbi:MAG: ABC transporter ATP-binding protein [Tenericutes bacterium]|nr:ABC transporter ATP-binding protein [Mycoplasmatota bacterium]
MSKDREKILQVENLTVSFRTTQGMVRAVRGVTFDLYKGETLAIVGESGSGKSVSSRTIMGILAPNGIIDDGKIMYEGQDLTTVDEDHFHELRGNKIGMIFQDPMSSLNPIMRIGRQITEGMLLNGKRYKNRQKALYAEDRNIYKEILHNIDQLKKNRKKDLKVIKEGTSTKTVAEVNTLFNQQFAEKLALVKPAKAKFHSSKKAAGIKAKADLKAETERINALIAALDKADDTYKEKKEALKEELRRYIKVTKKEAYEKALKIMDEVGIPQPDRRFRQYPFQFSGGMRQRIVIAIALTASPDVLICDEPTTALDVTIQAQILELINNLRVERNLSVIFITHDLGVVANMADRIGVMYAGKIVEIGTSEDIFYSPTHPYTWALLSSMPDLDSKDRLVAIPGTPPNMLFPPKGDAFADRNIYAMKIDFERQPPMFKISETHSAATWLLHPDAPKVNMPDVIKVRIDRMLAQSEEETV